MVWELVAAWLPVILNLFTSIIVVWTAVAWRQTRQRLYYEYERLAFRINQLERTAVFLMNKYQPEDDSPHTHH